MNVYECNGENIFMSWKMECSIQRGEDKSGNEPHNAYYVIWWSGCEYPWLM